jgi:two-component system OmpR family sensor kinase/two-component system sensor histidine kinase BaeS
MKLKGRHLRNLTFFWQMLLAFVIVTGLIGIGIYVTSRIAFQKFQNDMQNIIPVINLVRNKFTDYYAVHGSWQGIDLVISTNSGEEVNLIFGKMQEMPITLASADGRILITDDPERIGHMLTDLERSFSSTIEVDGETVGFFNLPIYSITAGAFAPPRFTQFRTSLRRFLGLEVLILMTGLILGAVILRQLSTPLMKLTSATRAIAEGDLSVRVPEDYPGEFKTLAISFNSMAHALEHADELRRNMTADVAHELRTPLSVIRGKLEGVLDGVYPASEEHLSPVLEEAEVLTRLVEDLRLIALAEAGQLPIEFRPLNVLDLIQDARVNFTPQANDGGIEIVVDAPAHLPDILADWRRVSQILGNLMINAVRHTPAGGVITLSAVCVQDKIQVTVKDTGIGIDAAELPYVFDRFWRGEKSRSRQTGGSGLGLAIVKQLIELQGGKVWAESTLGEGTAITFTLPVAKNK